MRSEGPHRHKGAWAALAAVLVASVACEERAPTALDDGPLPEAPRTVEVELDWSDFGSDFQVIGGFGTAASVGAPYVAHTYEGTLEARTLLRFGAYPAFARVVDPDGVTVNDGDITYVAGHLTLGFDTTSSVVPGPVTIRVSGLDEEWNPGTASWTYAVDSIGDQRAWTEAGAGPAILMAQTDWDPSLTDSVTLALDSTAAARWADATDETRGGRIEALTDGVLLRVNRARLRITMRSTIRPDSLVEDTVLLSNRTFVYDPAPPAPSGVRVGGVPSWRAVMQVSVPELTGPPELCAAVGCPYALDAGQVSYAAIELTSRASEAAFQPADSVRLDARSVLTPSILPKSPLGLSQTGGFGTAVAPEAFGSGAGVAVDVPITSFLRALLAGPDEGGRDPPGMLALLSAAEPSGLSFASFDGPTDPSPPRIRMILTVGQPQELP